MSTYQATILMPIVQKWGFSKELGVLGCISPFPKSVHAVYRVNCRVFTRDLILVGLIDYNLLKGFIKRHLF